VVVEVVPPAPFNPVVSCTGAANSVVVSAGAVIDWKVDHRSHELVIAGVALRDTRTLFADKLIRTEL
jgi:hypothetical protein